MKITYILDSPTLGGGVKVVFQHASLLIILGYQVSILGVGSQPSWIRFDGNYIDYSSGLPTIPHQDIIIATYWTTIAVAERLQSDKVIHFCQGYEGGLAHLLDKVPAIEAIYLKPIPTVVVQPNLGHYLEQHFPRKTYVVSPPIDSYFQPKFRFFTSHKPKILIQGIFEAESKGIPFALKVVCNLRAMGLQCEVIRISTFPLSEQEKQILYPDVYYFKIPPSQVAEVVRSCDLAIYTATKDEGFGLPLLEAMVSQVPLVATDTPVNRFLTQGSVPLSNDVKILANEAYKILRNPIRWHNQRRKIYNAAQKFHPNQISQQLEGAIQWAVSQLENTES